MSRAFTREIDDIPTPPLPEKPISAARNLVTPAGARRIEGTIESLLDRIARTSDTSAEADLKRDLRYWEARKASMEIVEPDENETVVKFGVTVTVEKDGVPLELTIVGEDEADPQIGCIAWTAPLARALNGARVGDVIELDLPGRLEEMSITAIRSNRENSAGQR